MSFRSLHWRHISLYNPSNNYTKQFPLRLSCLLRMRDYCIQRSNSFVLLQRLAVMLCEEVMFSDSLFHLTFTFAQSLQNACLLWLETHFQFHYHLFSNILFIWICLYYKNTFNFIHVFKVSASSAALLTLWLLFPEKVNNLIIDCCCLINNWSYTINVAFLLTSIAQIGHYGIICTLQRPISFSFFLLPSALCHPLSPQGIMLYRPLSQIIPYCAPNMSLHSAWGLKGFCFHLSSIHSKPYSYCKYRSLGWVVHHIHN